MYSDYLALRLWRKIPYERLCPMLCLATDWGYVELRSWAISKISRVSDRPLSRIILARRAHVPQWLSDAYVELATRLEPISGYVGQVLGVESVLAVSAAREKVLQRRFNHLINTPEPKHSPCRETLRSSWKAVLTADKYHKAGSAPSKAIIEALAEDSGNLCDQCNTKDYVREWLGLDEDKTLAEDFFRDRLGKSIEKWSSSPYTPPSI